jgi:membrane protein YqaA with SNARE-associated domain
MNKKDLITTIAGVIFAMATALQGFEVPDWLRIVAAIIAAGAGSLMGIMIGKKANLKKKSPHQVKKENEL